MPYLSAAACTVSASCPAVVFPSVDSGCVCDYATGGINELYFVPCTAVFSQANVTSPTWYTDMITAATFGRSGIGLGSISKKGDKKDRVGSCRTEQIINITWGLKFQIKCFDKTSARKTNAQLNMLITKFQRFLVIARMCDGAETVLPIGQFVTSDVNWTVPDNFEDNQVVEFEITWKELALPSTVDVAGLAAVLPKLQ